VTPDADQLARRIVRHRRLLRHLPSLDPLVLLPADDETVEQYVAVAVDLAPFISDDGTGLAIAAEGIHERADFTVYVPEWRRLYVLANDGESVAVADGDALAGEVAGAAVYHLGELVAGLAEPQLSMYAGLSETGRAGITQKLLDSGFGR